MKILNKLSMASVLGLLLVSSLFGSPADKNSEISKRLKEGALLVDARTPGEFSAKHVQGAINLPYDTIAHSIGQYETNKTKAIVIYCRSGNRSGRAKESLIEMGYTNVLNAGSIGNMQKLVPPSSTDKTEK